MIYHMEDHSISLYHAMYDTSIVDKYFYTITVNTSTKFYKTNFPSDIIFTEDGASNSDDKVENLTR